MSVQRVLVYLLLPLLIAADRPTEDQPSRVSAALSWSRDFSDMTAHEVLDVNGGDAVIVDLAGVRTRVRLQGIQPVARSRARRDVAHQVLQNLLNGETVYLEQEPVRGKTGGERRSGQEPATRAYLFRAPDGLFVNLELVRQGYARAAVDSSQRYGELFAYYEALARKHKKGLWAPPPTPPADDGDKPTPNEDATSADSKPADDSSTADKVAAVTVYVTASGTRYHRKECSYLHGDGMPMSLKDAKTRGLKPCSRCDPPE